MPVPGDRRLVVHDTEGKTAQPGSLFLGYTESELRSIAYITVMPIVSIPAASSPEVRANLAPQPGIAINVPTLQSFHGSPIALFAEGHTLKACPLASAVVVSRTKGPSGQSKPCKRMVSPAYSPGLDLARVPRTVV